MKKFVLTMAIFTIFAAFVCTVVACQRGDELLLYVPDGAPALSVAKIVDDGRIGEGIKGGTRSVKTVIATGENVIAKCVSGEADMAVLPTNAAVKICSQSDEYIFFSVNVYGVLYIVGTQQVTSLKDLQGKRLYSIGLGNTPQYVFQTICDAQGVKYREYDGENTLYGEIMLKYFSDASEIIPQVLAGKADFALVGEPAATQLMGKLLEKGKGAYNLFNLQTLWKEATDSDVAGYPQASMIVRRSIYNSAIQRMLSVSLSHNGTFLLQNADRLQKILTSAGSTLNIGFTEDIIGRCNLAYIDGRDAKSDIEKYLEKFPGMETFLPLDPNIFGA